MRENSEIQSIIDEINEEVKHDQLMSFLNKHRNIVLSVIVAIVAVIFIYSSLHSRKQKLTEQVTTALVNIVQSPHGRSDLMLGKLIETAPAELKPLLSVIKYGQRLQTQSEVTKNAEELLQICNKNGVDQIWKDLAAMIYASYRVKSVAELIKMIEPLNAEDRPFRFSALELLGMLYADEGKFEKTIECLQKIIDNKEAPKTLKSRVSVLIEHLRDKVSSSELKVTENA